MKSRGISFRQEPGAKKPARGKKFTEEAFRMGHAQEFR
jgi:hypothetical protein